MCKPIPHIHAELIKAWADGAEIQCKPHPMAPWCDTTEPSWTINYEYRIKPEPKPDVVRYGRASWIEYAEHLNTERMMNATQTTSHWTKKKSGSDNIKATFDGETGKLKSVEMI